MMNTSFDPEKIFDDWCMWEYNCKLLRGGQSPAGWDEHHAFVDACRQVMNKYGVSFENVLEIIKTHCQDSNCLRRLVNWCESSPNEMYAIYDQLSPFDLDEI